MQYEDLAERIREMIRESGSTQKQIAERCGFSTLQLNDMLHGRKILRAEYLPTIAAALGVTAGALFGETEQGRSAPSGPWNGEILAAGIARLAVIELPGGREIAAVTPEEITAAERFAVKIIPDAG